MISESEKQAFNNNLSVITSNGSLIKLNLGDETVLQKRCTLVLERNRKLPDYTSAVLVYFCNILNQRGYAAGSKEQFPSTLAVADVLTVGWSLYNASKVISDEKYTSIKDMTIWVEGKLKEAFSYGLNDSMRPSATSLQYIIKDFDRISRVYLQTK